MGNCWAVTVMGSSNTVVADGVTHDITVYGWDETVFYHNGAPFVWTAAANWHDQPAPAVPG